MKKLNNRGFSAVEGLLVLIIAGALIFVGWYVWQNGQTKETSSPSPVTTQPSIQTIPGNGHDDDEFTGKWTTITNSTINLEHWKVSMTLPESLVNKAVVSIDSNGYWFWIKAAVDNKTCTDYMGKQSLGYAGLSVGQFNPESKAEGFVGTLSAEEQKMTIGEYYKAHKSSEGNYFVSPNEKPADTNKFWKVGDNFYTASSLPTAFTADKKGAFTKACPDVPFDYETSFADALSSLKVY